MSDSVERLVDDYGQAIIQYWASVGRNDGAVSIARGALVRALLRVSGLEESLEQAKHKIAIATYEAMRPLYLGQDYLEGCWKVLTLLAPSGENEISEEAFRMASESAIHSRAALGRSDADVSGTWNTVEVEK